MINIDELCKNCDNYNECFDGGDYSTDCNGGFIPRKDFVELQGKLQKAINAIEIHHAEFHMPINESTIKLWKTLEELR